MIVPEEMMSWFIFWKFLLVTKDEEEERKNVEEEN